MQVARKLQILDESIDERDSSFFTKNVGGEGDSGGPYIWNENGKQVLGGLYVGETVMDSGSVRAEFLQVKNYKDWINGRIAEL
jgi:secreted trypsin-like serine protease